jgi:hypothetical protein
VGFEYVNASNTSTYSAYAIGGVGGSDAGWNALSPSGWVTRCPTLGCDFIDPGSPWHNAWIESFNGRLRDELVNSWRFDSLLEAHVIIEDWRLDYNANQPHSAHTGLTPTEYALQWTNTHQPQAA